MQKTLLTIVLLALTLAIPATAQNRNRRENKSLLGVVTEPHSKGIRVMHVLPKSPAAKAKLKAGDVITAIDKNKIKKNWDLDDVLRKLEPKTKITISYIRKKTKAKTNTKLIARKSYKGDFLKPAGKGKTGFKAPEIFAYAWANTSKSQPAPTKKNMKGKVVVFHCFQSW